MTDSFLANDCPTVSLGYSLFPAWTWSAWQRTWRAVGLKRQTLHQSRCTGGGRRRLPACHNRTPGAKLCSWIRQAQCLTINCPEIPCCLSTQQEISMAGMSGQPTLQLAGEGPNPAVVRATSCRGRGNLFQTLAWGHAMGTLTSAHI